MGKSSVKFHNGCEYIGQFVNDEMEGNGIFTDSAGNRYMTVTNDENAKPGYRKNTDSGTYIKGKLYGKGEIKYRNGNIYLGYLKGSKRDGVGEMIYNETSSRLDGDLDDIGVYKGSFRRDQRSGNGRRSIFNLLITM